MPVPAIALGLLPSSTFVKLYTPPLQLKVKVNLEALGGGTGHPWRSERMDLYQSFVWGSIHAHIVEADNNKTVEVKDTIEHGKVEKQWKEKVLLFMLILRRLLFRFLWIWKLSQLFSLWGAMPAGSMSPTWLSSAPACCPGEVYLKVSAVLCVMNDFGVDLLHQFLNQKLQELSHLGQM